MSKTHGVPRDDPRHVAGVRRLLRGRRHRHGVAVRAGWDRRHLAAARDPAGRAADGPAPPLVAVRGGAAADPRAHGGDVSARTCRRRSCSIQFAGQFAQAAVAAARAAASARPSAAAGQPAPHGRVHRGGGVPGAVRRPRPWWRGCSSPAAWCTTSGSRGNGGVLAAASGAVIVAAPILYLVEGGLATIRRAPRQLVGAAGADRRLDRGAAGAVRLGAGAPALPVADLRAAALAAVVGGSLRPRRAGPAPAGRRAGGAAVHQGRPRPVRRRLGRPGRAGAAGILLRHLHPADAAGGAGAAARAGGRQPAPQPGAVPLGGRGSDRAHLPLPGRRHLHVRQRGLLPVLPALGRRAASARRSGSSFPRRAGAGVGRSWQPITPERPGGVDRARRARGPGGEVRWQQWTDRGFFDERGRIVEYQAVGRDITERKRGRGGGQAEREAAAPVRAARRRRRSRCSTATCGTSSTAPAG